MSSRPHSAYSRSRSRSRSPRRGDHRQPANSELQSRRDDERRGLERRSRGRESVQREDRERLPVDKYRDVEPWRRDDGRRRPVQRPPPDAAADRWRHDKFEGPPSHDTRAPYLSAGAPFGPSAAAATDVDPYHAPRRSKAYEGAADSSASLSSSRPSGVAAAAALRSAIAAGAGSTALGSHRSSAPDDEYEWKSKAGGVAIFVKKPPPAALFDAGPAVRR